MAPVPHGFPSISRLEDGELYCASHAQEARLETKAYAPLLAFEDICAVCAIWTIAVPVFDWKLSDCQVSVVARKYGAFDMSNE